MAGSFRAALAAKDDLVTRLERELSESRQQVEFHILIRYEQMLTYQVSRLLSPAVLRVYEP